MENNPIVIIGTGPEGRIALDIFNSEGLLVYGFLTDREEQVRTDLNDVGIFGTLEDEDVMKVLKGSGVDYIVAWGEIEVRKEQYEAAAALAKRPARNAVHRLASVSEYAAVGFGNLVNAGAVINPNAVVGDNNIIHSHVSVEPDAKVGNYCTLSSGARISGNVVIEDGVFIGTGAVIYPGVKVGKGSLVGAGSVVLKEVEPRSRVFGNPAQPVK